MGFIETYLFVVLGIIISIILPILRKGIPKEKGTENENLKITKRLSGIAKPYLTVMAFSMVTALIILAILGESFEQQDWRVILWAGYTWDSLMQKGKG